MKKKILTCPLLIELESMTIFCLYVKDSGSWKVVFLSFTVSDGESWNIANFSSSVNNPEL